MFCSKCGNKVRNTDKFCPKCGNNLKTESTSEKETVVEEVNSNYKGLATASMVIGIVSIVCSFLAYKILVIPIVGLIFGIVATVKKAKNFSGIILNAIALTLVVIFSFFYAVGSVFGLIFDRVIDNINSESTSENVVVGSWICSEFDVPNQSDSYSISMDLYSDGSFLWAKQGDASNNYVSGDYVLSDVIKTTKSGDYSYYSLVLDGKEYYKDGVEQDEKYYSEYEIGVATITGIKRAILINKDTDRVFYCSR